MFEVIIISFYIYLLFITTIVTIEKNKKEYYNIYILIFDTEYRLIDLIFITYIFYFITIIILTIYLEKQSNTIKRVKYFNHTLLNKLFYIQEEYSIPVHIKTVYINTLLENRCICPICLEDISLINNIYLTLCGHIFHHKCIKECLIYSKKCPTCRQVIDFDIYDDLIIQ